MPNLSNLEIDVANLVSFEFCARELIANFEHVRSLAEMSIEGDYCMHVVYSLHQFSSFLPQLRTLKSNPMAVTVRGFNFVLFIFTLPSCISQYGDLYVLNLSN